MPEDAKRRNSRKKKKRKAAKKRSFFQSIFSAVKYVVLSINRYTTRTDDRGPDREFHLGRHKLTFVGFMALLLVVLVVILLAFNGHSVKVANESIIVTGLPDDFEGYRILHISDLAGKNFGEGQSTLMRVIDNLSYNAVVLTGDMVGKSGDPQPLYDLIEALGTRRPVYFIAGDSDPAPAHGSARQFARHDDAQSDGAQRLGAGRDRARRHLCGLPAAHHEGLLDALAAADTLLNLNVTQTLDNLKEEVEQETDSMLIGIEESYVSLPFTNYRMNVMSKSAALISSVSSQDLIPHALARGAHRFPAAGFTEGAVFAGYEELLPLARSGARRPLLRRRMEVPALRRAVHQFAHAPALRLVPGSEVRRGAAHRRKLHRVRNARPRHQRLHASRLPPAESPARFADHPYRRAPVEPAQLICCTQKAASSTILAIGRKPLLRSPVFSIICENGI